MMRGAGMFFLGWATADGGELAVETTRDLNWSSEQSSLQTRYESRYRDNTRGALGARSR